MTVRPYATCRFSFGCGAIRIGGALEGCRLVEHVATHVLTPFMGGSFGELLGALAIGGRASDGDGRHATI